MASPVGRAGVIIPDQSLQVSSRHDCNCKRPNFCRTMAGDLKAIRTSSCVRREGWPWRQPGTVQRYRAWRSHWLCNINSLLRTVLKLRRAGSLLGVLSFSFRLLKPHGELTVGHLGVLNMGGSKVGERDLVRFLVGDRNGALSGGNPPGVHRAFTVWAQFTDGRSPPYALRGRFHRGERWAGNRHHR